MTCLLVALCLLAPLEHTPARVGLLEVVDPGSGGPFPFALGLDRPVERTGREGQAFRIETDGGGSASVVSHRAGSGSILHGVLSQEDASGVESERGNGVPGRPALPRCEVQAEPSGSIRILAGDEFEIGPGSCIGVRGFLFAFEPPVDGAWRTAHACAARIDLVLDGTDAGGTLRVRLVVSIAAGSTSFVLDTSVEAEAAGAYPSAIGFRVVGDGALAIGLGERWLAPEGEDRVVAHRGGQWKEGEVELGAGPRGVVRLASGNGDGVVIAPGSPRGVAIEQLRIAAGGAGVDLPIVLAGEQLAAGEARIARLLVADERGTIPRAPIVLPARAADVADPLLRSAFAARGHEDPLLAHALELAKEFLAGPEHGLIVEGNRAGDWRMDRDAAGNLEYDTTLGLLGVAFLRRDGEAFRAAVAAADHLLSCDRDASGTGFFFTHGAGHRTLAVEAGHQWIGGLVALQRISQDLLRGPLLERALADQRAVLGQLDLESQLPRSLGWGLQVLVDLAKHSKKEDGLGSLIRRWRTFLLDRVRGGGPVLLTPLGEGSMRHSESPFVQAGIILPALMGSLDVVPSDRDRARTLELARYWARTAIVEREVGPRLPGRVVHDARTGKTIRRTGTVPAEFAALFLAGLFAADPSLRGDSNLQRLREALPEHLALSRKQFHGRDLSLLLRSLPILAGAHAEAKAHR